MRIVDWSSDVCSSVLRIVFLAVTAEESGLLGSKYYAENPIFPLAQTVGGVNMDALNAIGPAKDIVVVGGGKSELDAYVEKLAKMTDRTVKAEPTPEKIGRAHV